jgi:hypothetical protein
VRTPRAYLCRTAMLLRRHHLPTTAPHCSPLCVQRSADDPGRNFLAAYRILTDIYRGEYFWYEGVLMVHRLVLALISTFGNSVPVVRATAMAFVCLLALVRRVCCVAACLLRVPAALLHCGVGSGMTEVLAARLSCAAHASATPAHAQQGREPHPDSVTVVSAGHGLCHVHVVRPQPHVFPD